MHSVLRGTKVLFIVGLHDAIRTDFGFFQACPRDLVDIVDSRNLADFKPLVKRDQGSCFRFCLHHHLSTPI